MKYVYVLASSENDYYCEQCIISITSLLKHNTDAEIILLMDDITNNNLKGYRSEVIRITSKVIVKEFPNSMNQKMRSRMLKTSMRNLIEGKFIYIDLDTVIVEKLELGDYCNSDVAMVIDKHVPATEEYSFLFANMYKNANKMGYSIGYENKHFNSGVIYVNDTPKAYEFFSLWHNLYMKTTKKGINIDQTSLNEANYRMNGIIKELDGIWNVMSVYGMKYLSEAKIIHYLGYQPKHKHNIYFNSQPFELCNEGCFEKMRAEGSISKEIYEIIEHPKKAFKNVAIIPEDCIAFYLLFSNHMRLLKYKYIKFHRIYNFTEKIYARLFEMIFHRA